MCQALLGFTRVNDLIFPTIYEENVLSLHLTEEETEARRGEGARPSHKAGTQSGRDLHSGFGILTLAQRPHTPHPPRIHPGESGSEGK